MDCLTEKLILSVQKHPILYDLSNKNYRNVKKKDIVWNKIGSELKQSGDNLKKKWKNIRDCYSRHIRSEKPGQVVAQIRYYKSWPWAKQMEVFKPFLKFAQTDSRVEADLNESSESTSHDVVVPSKKRKYEKKKKSPESSVDKVIEYIEENRKTSADHSFNLNATEHMFLSFAKTVETFSAQRQATVKMKIANIVLEEELLQREDEQYTLDLKCAQEFC